MDNKKLLTIKILQPKKNLYTINRRSIKKFMQIKNLCNAVYKMTTTKKIYHAFENDTSITQVDKKLMSIKN